MKSLLVATMLLVQSPQAQTPVAPKDTAQAGPIVGQDTIDTVKSRYGKPNSVQTQGDGKTILVYISMRARVKGSSFIPVVGMFTGGAKGKTVIKTFIFGPDQKLENYSIASADSNCTASILGASCN